MEKEDPSKEAVAKSLEEKSPEKTPKATEEKKPSSPKKQPDVTPEEKKSEHDQKEEENEEKGVEDLVAGMASVASGWFSGFVKTLESAATTASTKSVEVYDMVKKDLSEFSEAVQAETSTMIADTSSMLSTTSKAIKENLKMEDESSAAGQMKKSVSGFLSHVQKAFTPDTIADDDTEAYVMRDGQPVLLDRLQTELYRLAADPETYLAEPPESERVRYEVWSADLDLEARQAELSDLLASNKVILDQYTKLVPAQVSHVLFWHRYLFRVHLAEEREKQREELRKRAEQMTSPGQAEKQITWEEEDFSHHVEVTDAQAAELLEQYDQERRELKSQAAAAAGAGGGGGSGTHSPGGASSNDDDWVKEDLDAETNSSVGNDWEKWD